MKTMKKLIAMLVILSFALSMFACGSAEAPVGGYYTDSIASGGLAGDVESDDAAGEAPEGDEEPDKTEDEVQKLPAGMITAGAWVDNDNYQLWLDLFAQTEDENGNTVTGKFNHFLDDDYTWGLNSQKRVKVTVKCGENAVAGAIAVAYDSEHNVLFSAVSDAQGNAYLFVDENEGTVEVQSGEGSAIAEFTADNRELEVVLEASAEKRNVIEIMFVVDVTGSMGDEISFLKRELEDVIEKIVANDTDTVVKLALLFYRDLDDRVPFDYYDFTEVMGDEGLAKQLNALGTQIATGGGDMPEAVDEALEMAVSKQWSTGSATKIIFHVLDAPAHSKKENKEKFAEAVNAAAEKGIRICPIICSGANTVTEYTMREAAIHTGGTFIFVTDDSGIGNSHYDPDIPNVTVELLNSMLVRLVQGYHTGEFEDPIYWKDDPNLNK